MVQDEQEHKQDKLLDHVLSAEKFDQQINDHHATETPAKKIYTKHDLHRLRWSVRSKSTEKFQIQAKLFLLADELDQLKAELIEAEMQHKSITVVDIPTRGRKADLNGLKITEAQAKKIMEMLVSSGALDEDAMTSLQQTD